MSREPPAGFTCRPPELTDAEAILELATAYNTPLVGHADYTLDDARDDLVEPGFDRERDGRLVVDESNRVVGYGWVYGATGGDQAGIEVMALDPAARQWLLDWTLDRARELARDKGHRELTVDHGVFRADEALRSAVAANGFAAATTFHRMRIDHDGPVARPVAPAGLTLREGARDEPTRRDAYEVMTAAFADHFGFVRKTYAEWTDAHDAKSTFDWSQMWVADLDGRPVGVCERTDQFVEDENCGYVAELGVLAEARGRGIAKYLLRHAFAVDAAAGRAGTILHVDTNNTTPALGLYEAVGMRPVLIVDIWRQTLSVDGAS